MFATLLGALPQPQAATPDEAVRIAVRAQEDANLEPITDGRLGDLSLAAVERWRTAAGLTDRAVKATLAGPSSVGFDREAVAALAQDVAALAAAGCPLIEIEDSGAGIVGRQEDVRRSADAHRQITDAGAGAHLSLSIVGAAAGPHAIDMLVESAYASFAFDLIAGPDGWNAVRRLPGERGVIVGVLSSRPVPEPKEVMLWAAHYAASSMGRGIARVGLGSAGSWANLTWDGAVDRMARLGNAARLASLPPGEELASQVDPRSIDARSAAIGRRPRPTRRT